MENFISDEWDKIEGVIRRVCAYLHTHTRKNEKEVVNLREDGKNCGGHCLGWEGGNKREKAM